MPQPSGRPVRLTLFRRGHGLCSTCSTAATFATAFQGSRYDFGFIGVSEFSLRIRCAFDSIARMAHYQGHLFNWYNTQDLEALNPRYVSTVDSGNFAGCLVALAHGCRELLVDPVVRREGWDGLGDSLDLLAEVVRGAGPSDTRALMAIIDKMAVAIAVGRDDIPAEVLYLRDEETAAVWSSTPQPAGKGVRTRVRHGAGYTSFERSSNGLTQLMTVFVPPDASVKIVRLKITNRHARHRRITATYYAEWVLGRQRTGQSAHIVSEFDQANRCLLASCDWNAEFAGRVAFVAAHHVPHSFTVDRTEFLGRRGSL